MTSSSASSPNGRHSAGTGRLPRGFAEAARRRGDLEGSRKTFRAAKKLWDAGEQEAGDVLGFAAEMAALEARQRR